MRTAKAKGAKPPLDAMTLDEKGEALDSLLHSLIRLARKSPAYKYGEAAFEVKNIEHKLPYKGGDLRRLLRGLASTHEGTISYASRFGLDHVYVKKPPRGAGYADKGTQRLSRKPHKGFKKVRLT